MREALKIVFYSPKGGSGKSTGVQQVSGYLAYKGQTLFTGREEIAGAKTLIIDADPSYNASQSFHTEPGRPAKCYTQLMFESIRDKRTATKEEIMETIVPAFSPEMMKMGTPKEQEGRRNLFIAPSRLDVMDRYMIELDDFLVRARVSKDGPQGFYTFFYSFFKPIFDEFHFIIIDAPGQITGSSYLNAICMADFVVSPSETDIYSTNAIREVQGILKRANNLANHPIDFLGFYFSRYSGSRSLDKEMLNDSAQIKEYLETSVRNLSIIPQLQGRKELIAFDANARNTMKDKGDDVDVFEKLTTEILNRMKQAVYRRKQMAAKRGE